MVRYSPSVLQKCANMLYMRAIEIIIVYTAIGAGIGWIAAYAYTRAYLNLQHIQLTDLPFIAAGVGGALLGAWLGNSRAFALKLQAQVVLCQLEIEKHTRNLEELSLPGVSTRIAA
jgi:hypothetical protein